VQRTRDRHEVATAAQHERYPVCCRHAYGAERVIDVLGLLAGPAEQPSQERPQRRHCYLGLAEYEALGNGGREDLLTLGHWSARESVRSRLLCATRTISRSCRVLVWAEPGHRAHRLVADVAPLVAALAASTRLVCLALARTAHSRVHKDYTE
jgi:hypothetical protein